MEAKFVKDVSDKFVGSAIVVKLDPPMKYSSWEEVEGEHCSVEKDAVYVVVSAAITFDQGSETFIFPSDKEGNVTNWGELEGSFRGSLDHEKALNNAGYDLVY
jgi:hypothetical protein